MRLAAGGRDYEQEKTPSVTSHFRFCQFAEDSPQSQLLSGYQKYCYDTANNEESINVTKKGCKQLQIKHLVKSDKLPLSSAAAEVRQGVEGVEMFRIREDL